jgi:hypothetical protein
MIEVVIDRNITWWAVTHIELPDVSSIYTFGGIPKFGKHRNNAAMVKNRKLFSVLSGSVAGLLQRHVSTVQHAPPVKYLGKSETFTTADCLVIETIHVAASDTIIF